MHMLRADEVSGQSHCNLWWRWWWSDAMWETLIRLWLWIVILPSSFCCRYFSAILKIYGVIWFCCRCVCVCVCRQLGIQHYRMCIYCLNERYTWLHCKLQWSSLLLECFAKLFLQYAERRNRREPHSRLNGYAWTMLDHIFYDRLWLEPLLVQKVFF
jgi:hypothetical protein